MKKGLIFGDGRVDCLILGFQKLFADHPNMFLLQIVPNKCKDTE